MDRRAFVKGGLAAAVAVAVPWRDDGVTLESIAHPPGNRLVRANDLSEESLELLLIEMKKKSFFQVIDSRELPLVALGRADGFQPVRIGFDSRRGVHRSGDG